MPVFNRLTNDFCFGSGSDDFFTACLGLRRFGRFTSPIRHPCKPASPQCAGIAPAHKRFEQACRGQ